MANKNIMPPTKERKADTTKNGNDLSEYIERQKKREKRLYPLRINQTTVIYVTKDKQTSEYADWYRRERLKII
jgi:hypothetical protein